jgi:putative tryptophan/tyrosine transport system substrate-binding protein
MRRREFITLVGSVAAAWPLAARAQQPNKIPRLCFLTFDSVISQSTRFDSFFEGLRDLGYVDGQTITIDYLSAGGRGEQFQPSPPNVFAQGRHHRHHHPAT